MSVAKAVVDLKEAQAQLEAAGTGSAVAQLVHRFGLSAFEQDILLLCLAFELESQVGWTCGLIQDTPHRPFPTFGLAMSLFPDCEWIALPPDRPLRKFRLVEFRHPAGTPLFGAELRLEETVLHYLRGIASVDSRLASFATPVKPRGGGLSQSQQAVLDRVCRTLSEADDVPAVMQLLGPDSTESLRFARGIADALRCKLFGMPLECLPTSTIDLEDFAHLWQRDSALFGLALVLDAQESVGPGDASRTSRLLRLLANVSTPILVITRERLDLVGVNDLCIDVAGPTVKEQFAVWQQALPNGLKRKAELAGELSRQFMLDGLGASEAVAAVMRQTEGKANAAFPNLLRRECRERTRPRLEGLAQRIDVKATWSDLVLSPEREELLKQLRGQVQSRWRVYDEWGMADRMNRGLGISACSRAKVGRERRWRPRCWPTT